MQDIARTLELEGATTTPLIQRMEKQGLLSRQRSAEDERRVDVCLTAKGKKLKEKASEIPYTLGCSLGINEKVAKELISHMSDIKANLK